MTNHLFNEYTCKQLVYMNYLYIDICIYIYTDAHIQGAPGQVFTGEAACFLTAKQGFLSAVLIGRLMHTSNSVLRMLENC